MAQEPDYVFYEGWDKYGPVGAWLNDRMLMGDWTLLYNQAGLGVQNNWWVIEELSGDVGGGALEVDTGVSPSSAYALKTLPGFFKRWIGSVVIRGDLAARNVGVGVWREGIPQACWTINAGTGRISVRRGFFSDSVLIDANEFVLANECNTITWDFLIKSSGGHAKIWLNGVETSIQDTGIDMAATVDGYSQLIIGCHGEIGGARAVFAFDHLEMRCWEGDGDGDEVPYLDNPIIETSVPMNDQASAFDLGLHQLGDLYNLRGAGTNANGANNMFLRRYAPRVSGDLESVAFLSTVSHLTAKFTPVVYSSVAGVATSLLATGPEVIGIVAGPQVMPLTAPLAVSAGVDIFIGYMANTAITIYNVDSQAKGFFAARTYTLGPPNPAPALTSGVASFLIWGNMSGVTERYSQVDVRPPQGEWSFNQSGTVGDRDSFQMTPLVSDPIIIHGTCAKVFASRSDAGARTLDIEAESGGFITAGDSSGMAPPASFRFIQTAIPRDPNGDVAWTKTTLDASFNAYKIAS